MKSIERDKDEVDDNVYTDANDDSAAAAAAAAAADDDDDDDDDESNAKASEQAHLNEQISSVLGDSKPTYPSPGYNGKSGPESPSKAQPVNFHKKKRDIRTAEFIVNNLKQQKDAEEAFQRRQEQKLSKSNTVSPLNNISYSQNNIDEAVVDKYKHNRRSIIGDRIDEMAENQTQDNDENYGEEHYQDQRDPYNQGVENGEEENRYDNGEEDNRYDNREEENRYDNVERNGYQDEQYDNFFKEKQHIKL
ncbi:hypothetical protein DPMN_096623 [Dreissena polymorpha]|uniref:Uncharacterized protein n=1 Tax=Dreissena polymorpha TaxID=45954 RepID=A0A9D4R3Y3_DREPO|nr:hypothetical protein DPMN_096623 [Dreissena polymorpha]